MARASSSAAMPTAAGWVPPAGSRRWRPVAHVATKRSPLPPAFLWLNLVLNLVFATWCMFDADGALRLFGSVPHADPIVNPHLFCVLQRGLTCFFLLNVLPFPTMAILVRTGLCLCAAWLAWGTATLLAGGPHLAGGAMPSQELAISLLVLGCGAWFLAQNRSFAR